MSVGAATGRQAWRRKVIPAGTVAALVLVAAGNCAAVAGAGSRVGGASLASMTSTAASAPELSATAAAERAVSEARGAQDHGELEVEVAPGTFGEARAVLAGRTPSGAVDSSPNPELAEWYAGAAYLIVMKGGTFRPNVSTPPWSGQPAGEVMSVIADAHEGFREALSLGEAAPQTSALGPVTQLAAPAGSLRVVPAMSVAGVGRLTGRVYASGRPAREWRVLVRHAGLGGRAVRDTVRTTVDGSFAFRLRGGRYVVTAENSRGRQCGIARVAVRARREVAVRIDCGRRASR